MANLFETGNFILSSGQKSSWKIECDALTSDDWYTLATMIAERCGPFSEVIGVPRGGLQLAGMLQMFRTEEGPRLVVDDVYTTGNSIAKYAKVGDKVWVVFARNPIESSYNALFQMA